MLDLQIDSGALFYGQRRRRKEIFFDDDLRTLTLDIIQKTHVLMQDRKTPHAVYEKKCDTCSLYSLCLPKSCGSAPSVSRYLHRMLGGEL